VTDCYAERAALLALLACHYPAHLSPAPDRSPGFGYVLCLHIDDKQAAWHVSNDDLHWFSHIQTRPNHYDGHTSDEKYETIAGEIRAFDHDRWRGRAE
jgi:hypothetical protein